MAQVPITDKWQKTFIKNDDGTYTLRCSLITGDIQIGTVEIKDAISDLRATLEDRGGKGAITVQIVDSAGDQIESFGASVVGLKNILGTQVDPATEDTLQDILTELEQKTEPADTQKVQEQNPLDISGLATSAKQLPDNHQVTISNSVDISTLATSAKQDVLKAKFPFEDYQYMGSQASGDLTWYGFKQFGGSGWYVIQKDSTDDSDWQYAYSSVDTGVSWTTAWGDPAALTFGDPPSS